jgi:hypothetical protein
MDLLHTVAIGSGLAWASGMRLYGVVFFAGLLGRIGVIALPGHLGALTHPLVIGVAGVLFITEFLADKVPGVDSLWDALHTFIRVPAGALLAAASLGLDADPAWLVAAGLAGGALAGTSHFAKAGTRALINTSPEPFSNWAASFGEDLGVAGMVWLAFAYPAAFLVTLVAAVVVAVWMISRLWRMITGIFRRHSLRPAAT